MENQTKFNPVEFLTNELESQGFEYPRAWMVGLDERANDETLPETDRLFFVNRSLRLFLSEQRDRDTMQVRMLLAEGLEYSDWQAIVVKGVVPWLLNKLPANKRQLAQAAAEAASRKEVVVNSENVH